MNRFAFRALLAALPFVVIMAIAATCFAQPVPTPSPVGPSPLEQIVAMIQAGHWLPVIIAATLLLRKWSSPDSAFPISIPTRWLSSVSAFGGLMYGLELSIQSGTALGPAVLQCVVLAGSSGFADGLLTAIFNHANAPTWARVIVGVFDSVTASGGGSGSVAGDKPVPVVPASLVSKPTAVSPTASKRTLGRALGRMVIPVGVGCVGVGGLAVVASSETACTPAQAANVLAVLQEVQTWAQTFLSGAAVVWQLITPYISASSLQEANQAFQNAEASLTDALAAASAVTTAATNPAVIAQDITAINTAVQEVEAIVELWSGFNSDGGVGIAQKSAEAASHVASLHMLAAQIQAVRP